MQIRNIWWILLLKGILLIVFGLIALVWTPLTFVILSILVSIYFLIAGVLNIIHGLMTMHMNRYWFLTLVTGLLELGIGAYGLSRPVISILTFVIIVGTAFILRGIFEIIVAMDRDLSPITRILFVIAAVIEIIAGILILRYPVTGGLAFVWVLGVYALITGPIFIAMSIGAKDFIEELFAPTQTKMR